MVVECVSAPEVPVTVTVALPVVAVPDAVSVRVDVAVPFAGGVTGLVENAAVTPLGKPETLSVVAALKPFRLVIVMVLVPLQHGGAIVGASIGADERCPARKH